MEQTASSLVKGIADFQDHQRWFEFNQLYRPMIRNILINKGLRNEELDDVVQEVYLSMLSTIERFKYDRDKGRFRSWLGKISQRAASAHRRRQARESADLRQVDDFVEGTDSPQDYTDDRTRLCLELARSQFDERTWLPFYLRVIEETPIKEVQRITKMKPNAIYQSIHRVKQCLRELLSQLDNTIDNPPR